MTPQTDIKTQILYLEHELSLICDSAHEDIREDLRRVTLAGGKRLRPLLAYVTYSLGSDQKLPILPLMVMIELMHTASLIHDDVVDEGDLRRGVVTINKARGNFIAIQAADFLLAKAMEYLYIYKGTGIDEKLAAVSEKMCTGEFLQIDMITGRREQNPENYFEAVECKTVVFLEAAAECGGIAAGLDETTLKSLAEYGRNLGIAFQIKDDLLDVSGSSNYLKHPGQDKKRGIKSAPEIFGFKESEELVREYSGKAIESIKNLSNCEIKKTLIKLSERLCDRDK